MTLPEEKAEIDEGTKEREVKRPRAEQESVRQQVHSIEVAEHTVAEPTQWPTGIGKYPQRTSTSQAIHKFRSCRTEKIEGSLQFGRLQKI